MSEKAKPRRLNIHFRQKAKSFRADRQTQIFAKINRNIPQIMNKVNRKKLVRSFQKVKARITKDAMKFAKRSRKRRK